MASSKLKTLSYTIDYHIIGHVQCSQCLLCSMHDKRNRTRTHILRIIKKKKKKNESNWFFFLFIFDKFSSNWVNLYFITAYAGFVLWVTKMNARATLHHQPVCFISVAADISFGGGGGGFIVMRLFLIVFSWNETENGLLPTFFGRYSLICNSKKPSAILFWWKIDKMHNKETQRITNNIRSYRSEYTKRFAQ